MSSGTSDSSKTLGTPGTPGTYDSSVSPDEPYMYVPTEIWDKIISFLPNNYTCSMCGEEYCVHCLKKGKIQHTFCKVHTLCKVCDKLVCMEGFRNFHDYCSFCSENIHSTCSSSLVYTIIDTNSTYMRVCCKHCLTIEKKKLIEWHGINNVIFKSI